MRRTLGIVGALALVVIVAAFYVGSALAATPTPTPKTGTSTTAPANPSGNETQTEPKAGRGQMGWGEMGAGVMGRGMGFGLGGNLMGHSLDRIAQKLNMTAADLQTALQGGKTLKDVAASKNVNESDLLDFILAPEKDSLAVSVKYGQMTQQQADAALANAKARLTKLVEAPIPQPKPQALGISTQTLDRVAQKLGMQLADVQAALAKGDSLKTIAGTKNLSETDLVNLIVAPQADQMAVRVKYGYETQQQADQQLQNLKTQVTKLVETPGNQLRTGNGAKNGAGAQGRGARGAQPKASPTPSASTSNS